MNNAAPASEAGPITVTWHKVVTCILITLVGFNLRSVILGVPPVLPLIQHDLELSYTATGYLTALPVLALAVLAWPSGLIAERIGARLSVSIGLATRRGIMESRCPPHSALRLAGAALQPCPSGRVRTRLENNLRAVPAWSHPL